jgi:hypothetical protein
MKLFFLNNRNEEPNEIKSISRLQNSNYFASLKEAEMNHIRGGEGGAGEDGTEGSDIDLG